MQATMVRKHASHQRNASELRWDTGVRPKPRKHATTYRTGDPETKIRSL